MAADEDRVGLRQHVQGALAVADRVGAGNAQVGNRRVIAYEATAIARQLGDEILESLRQDPIVPSVQGLRLELPYDFTGEEYAQILSDTARYIAPALGWSPAQAVEAPDHGVPRAAATSRPSSITASA